MGKNKKFDANPTETLTEAKAEPKAEAPTEAKAEPKKGWYLQAAASDVNGRSNYRFAKWDGYPKKPNEIPITIDGEPAQMAVTSSGGWANEDTKGYNGYIRYSHPVRGDISGWILFGYKVDPRAEGFNLDFVTVDGSCDANPKREPANPEVEEQRKVAFKAKMDAKKAASDAEAAAAAELAAAEAAATA